MRHKTVFLSFVVGVFLIRTTYADESIDKTKSPLPEAPTIEEITVNVHPIFDENNPKENNVLFRFVNRLHINTKKHVIEKDITFKKGEPLDKHLLEESERLLRGRRYLAEATITAQEKTNKPAQTKDHSQKVQVDVREVWTLVPKLSYSSAGGTNHYTYGLFDSNFLGLGKIIKAEHSSTRDRTSDTLAYKDPNFGNHNQLSLSYSDNSDGIAEEFHFNNPFKSIRTPWSAGVDYQRFSRNDTLYNAGEEVERFGHENTSYSLFYGDRLNLSNDDRTHRITVGFDSISDNFFALPYSDTSNTIALPQNRDYTATWIEHSYIHNHFFEASNIQQINRTEDINLGSQWRFRLGIIDAQTEQLDQSTLVLLEYSKAFQLSPSQLLLTNLTTSGFYKPGEAIQSISRANFSYHWKNFERGQFFVMTNQTYGKNLFVDTPLELGGDTGLRGYPARFAAGDHLQLLTIEQRYFGQTEWFSLFHVGAAIFYDQGRVWGESAVQQSFQGTLRDIGVGLRISGTRTGGRDEGVHNVAHINLSYPLDGGTDIDKYQLSIQIKTSF